MGIDAAAWFEVILLNGQPLLLNLDKVVSIFPRKSADLSINDTCFESENDHIAVARETYESVLARMSNGHWRLTPSAAEESFNSLNKMVLDNISQNMSISKDIKGKQK